MSGGTGVLAGETGVLAVESGRPGDDELVALVLALTAVTRPARRKAEVRAAAWTLPAHAQQPPISWRHRGQSR
ncbi:acyl-CoA carboxylase epsilon subunit [Nocardia sp. NPDC056611]|uniref:acyl-CoA carboxylase epsilon subunit n=1 Tax=Nocardia sp. NPDC056611 TaxID=3345877 RepID=UPI00366FADCD